MAKTPGKIGQGRPETSASLIASEEVLFGQPVEYNTSDNEKANVYDVNSSGSHFAGVAVYDPSKGASNTDRSYESNDVMEILKEGVAKVRINKTVSFDQNGATDYFSYITVGDPIFAQPDGYVSGQPYFWGDPSEAVAGNGDNPANITTNYFGHAIGEALESTEKSDSVNTSVILVDFNQPDVN